MMDTLTLYDAARFQPARFIDRARATAECAGCALAVKLEQDRLVLTVVGDPAHTAEIGAWLLESWREWRRCTVVRMAS